MTTLWTKFKESCPNSSLLIDGSIIVGGSSKAGGVGGASGACGAGRAGGIEWGGTPNMEPCMQ
jgi:hypothetical protein